MPPHRRWLGAATAILLPVAVLVVHGWAYGRWIVDDAAITFAYARSISEGLGPVLQPGADRVEGYSNPAWLALLVAGRWLGLFDHGAWLGVPDIVAFPKLLGVMCGAGVFACFYVIARALTPRPALVAAAAGVALACVPSWVIWLVSGLENPLLALAVATLSAVLVTAATAGRLLTLSPAVISGLLAALAALTRPDGLIYVAAYPVVVLVLLERGQLRRAAVAVAASIVAFAAPVGLYVGWRMLTFGEVLPNTAIAKGQSVPGLDALIRPAELVVYLGPLAVVLAAGLVAVALTQASPGRQDRQGLLVLLVPLGLAVAAFAVLEGDWMRQFRFATPVWTLIAITTAVAASRALPAVVQRGRVLAIGAAALAAAVSGVVLVDGARDFRASPTVPMCEIASHMGWSFNGYAALLDLDDATLATPDVGGTALVSELQIIDLAGLVDAELARFLSEGDGVGFNDELFSRAPEFIELHHVWGVGVLNDPRFAERYVEIRRTEWTDGVWVRADLVTPRTLADLKTWDVEVAQPAERARLAAPRGSCGDRMVPYPDPLTLRWPKET